MANLLSSLLIATQYTRSVTTVCQREKALLQNFQAGNLATLPRTDDEYDYL